VQRVVVGREVPRLADHPDPDVAAPGDLVADQRDVVARLVDPDPDGVRADPIVGDQGVPRGQVDATLRVASIRSIRSPSALSSSSTRS